MVQAIINTVVTFIVSTVLGYSISRIRVYKEKLKKKTENESVQNMALQSLLKSQLTNVYFVYSELEKIPDYAYQNFLDMLGVYESLDGDGFVHAIAKKMEKWKITKTDIMK